MCECERECERECEGSKGLHTLRVSHLLLQLLLYLGELCVDLGDLLVELRFK